MTFGQAISTARTTAGLTQTMVADYCGITTQYICDLERDRRGPPGYTLTRNLANCLNLPRTYLEFLAGRIPYELWEELRARTVDPDTASAAWGAFARVMRGEQQS